MNDLDWCIEYLEKENNYSFSYFPLKTERLRALMNITMPFSLSEEFYKKQDNVLLNFLSNKKIITLKDLSFKKKIAIYKGDITVLKVDAIVNACNEKLLGCFAPLHNCIDNAIHSFAGLEVRRDLLKVMQEQGHDEGNGLCKVTKGYNLPSKFIFHTVGPKVNIGDDHPNYHNQPTKQDILDLKNCYLSCLKEASKMKLKSIAFPCISTGYYGFPYDFAAEIAFSTVNDYLVNHSETSLEYIIFNVFNERDYETYEREINKIN